MPASPHHQGAGTETAARPRSRRRARTATRVALTAAVLALTAALMPAASAAQGTTLALDRDFPDPAVATDGSTYYAYATASAGLDYQTATAPSPSGPWTWTGTDAMPNPPSWSDGGYWAPDVSRRSDGSWLMYFTAHDPGLGHECVGVATSGSPLGPFRPVGSGPLVCPGDQGGAIDASAFTDSDGSHWMAWKNDGNSVGQATHLYLQAMSADGTATAGSAVTLLTDDRSDESGVIEAPYLVHQGGHYVLFYSAGGYGGAGYEENYATATSRTGTYTKAAGTWLTTGGTGVTGPGGASVLRTGSGDWVYFHGWRGGTAYRAMYEASLGWSSGDTPVLGG
jgi:arabinan endo-1,5-alpha-L-arabinosidase